MSLLVPPDRREDLIATMHRVGVAAARERLYWDQNEPRPGHWDWQTRGYDQTRQWYAQAGIGVLEMCIGTPAWLEKDPARIYPRDLMATASAWAAIGEHWASNWQGLEIWNEPDIGSGGNQPADQYLPMLKAVRYGLRSRHIDVPVVGGAFAYFNQSYLDLAARNGLLEQSDALSFHYYGEPADLEARIGEYRAWMRGAGRGNLPLWITEIGPPWEGRPGTRAPAAEDAARGLKFARNAAEARACGIARIFPFVLVDYSEHGTRVFGLLDASGSPLRVLGDYAESIRELSGARYIGDLAFSPGSRVFERGDDTAVVVYTGREAPSPWPFPVTEMHGIDGRSLSAPDPADGLTYLTVKRPDVEGSLRRDTPAAALCAEAMETRVEPAPLSPVILEPIVDGAGTVSTTRGYQVAEGAAGVHTRVRVWNLGKTSATVTLDLQVPGNDAADTRAPGPRPLTIAAEGSAEQDFELPVDRLKPDRSGVCRVEIGAGPGISPAALNFILQRGLQEQLAGRAYRFALPIAELNRWKDNSAGKGTFSRLEGGGWAYDVAFTGGDRWAYPRFTPPQEAEPDKATALLLRARCVSPGTVRIMTWDRQGKNSYTAFPVIKADGEWHVALVPLESFLMPKPGEKIGRQIAEISVGLNSDTDTNRLEVSDLYLLGD